MFKYGINIPTSLPDNLWEVYRPTKHKKEESVKDFLIDKILGTFFNLPKLLTPEIITFLEKAAERTDTPIDDAVVKSLRMVSTFISILEDSPPMEKEKYDDDDYRT